LIHSEDEAIFQCVVFTSRNDADRSKYSFILQRQGDYMFGLVFLLNWFLLVLQHFIEKNMVTPIC